MDYKIITKNIVSRLTRYAKYDRINYALKQSVMDFCNNENDNRLEYLLNNIIIQLEEKNFSVDTLNRYKISVKRELKKINKNEKTISFNYFIDCDLEIYIIDTLYTFVLNDEFKSEIEKNCYGNIVDGSLRDLNDKTDKKSIFKHYKFNYNKWIIDAGSSADNYKNKYNYCVIETDFSRFYYNIDFDKIKSKIEKKFNCNFQKNLFKCIDYIYNKYKNVFKNIEEYKALKFNNFIEDPTLLPIGLPSAHVHSNMYILDYDKKMKKKYGSVFYGRYCDDTIMIFSYDSNDTFIYDCEIKQSLNKGLKGYNLKLQEEKVSIKHLGGQDALKEYFKKNKSLNAKPSPIREDSEPEVLNNFKRSLLSSNILNKVSDIKKDIKILPINNVLSLFNFYIPVTKNQDEIINNIDEKIVYSENDISYSYVSNIILFRFKFLGNSENVCDETKKLLEKIIDFLKKCNIDGSKDSFDIGLIIKDIDDSFKIIQMINTQDTKYEKAKLTSRKSVFELIKYDVENGCLKETEKYLEHIDESLQFRHIHMTSFLNMLQDTIKQCFSESTIDKIINDSDSEYEDELTIKKFKSFDKYISYELIVENRKENDTKDVNVFQPNINLSDEVLSTNELTYEETYNFIKIILNCNVDINKTNHLILPELYVHFDWLNILFSYIKNNDMHCTFGLKNFCYDNHFYNMIFDCVSFRTSEENYKNTLVLGRNKNNFTKFEIKFLKNKYPSFDLEKIIYKENYIYYSIHSSFYNFTSLLCYELTDIVARSLFRGSVNTILSPMMNRDTFYFDSIAYSLSRDLSCYVITSNSCNVGNSLIVQPRKNAEKILTEIKGGMNNYVVNSTINVKDLKEFQMNYEIVKLVDLESNIIPSLSEYFVENKVDKNEMLNIVEEQEKLIKEINENKKFKPISAGFYSNNK